MASLQGPLPIIALTPGMQVKFEAIDPTTGAAVAGVTISAATIYALDTQESAVTGELEPIFLLDTSP